MKNILYALGFASPLGGSLRRSQVLKAGMGWTPAVLKKNGTFKLVLSSGKEAR